MADDMLAAADLIADALDLSGTEISNVLDAAPVMARMPFVPSSNGTTHKYIAVTQNPVVPFRAINAGKDFDSSIDVAVSATLTYLDISFAVDKAYADVWRRGGAEALIAREGLAHIRSGFATLEDQFFNDTDTSAFSGLSVLTPYDTKDDSSGKVIDAGGTTASTGSSVWLLNVGEMTGVCMVYRGDGPGLELGETIVQNIGAADANISAYYTPGGGWFGSQVPHTSGHGVTRICNLTEDSGKGLTDDLLAQAIAIHPIGQKPTVACMSRRSHRQLQESRTATNATGAPAPFPTEAFGVELIVTDAIPDTETLLSAE